MQELGSPGFAVLDVETTGFSTAHRVLEIGVVLLSASGEVEGSWSSLINPDRDIPNSSIHGVYGRHVKDAPAFTQIARELFGLLDGRVLVAHNARFDARMLSQELARAGLAPEETLPGYVCTMELSKRLFPGMPSKLGDVLTRAGISNRNAHTALADAEATAELFQYFLRNGVTLPGAASITIDARPLSQLTANSAVPLTREAAEAAHYEQEQATTEETQPLELRPGDRVTLTGEMNRPRSEWEKEIREHGLIPGSLTKNTRVLVAADVDSLSSKAKKARRYEIPILAEQEFSVLLAGISDEEERITPEATVTIPPEVETPDYTPEEDSAYMDDFYSGSSDSASEVFYEEPSRESLMAALNVAQDALGLIANQHRGLDKALLPDSANGMLSGRAADVLAQLTDPEGDYQQVKLLVRGTASSALADFYAGLDTREQLIARKRLGTTSPATLDTLGQELGLTRERVRQLQSPLASRLEELANRGAVAELREAMAAHAFPVARIGGIVEQLPELRDEVPGWGLRLAEIIDAVDDSFAIEEDWVCFPSLKVARERTENLLKQGSDDYGVVPLDWVEERTALSPADLRDWLDDCGYRLFEGHVLTQTRSLPALGAGVLSIRGEPQDLDSLYEAIGQGRTNRSLANSLNASEGIVRVSATKWALPEWGYEEYSTLAKLIERRLVAATDAGDEGVPLTALLTELPSKFDVAENSVRTYASTGQFELVDGIVKWRSAAPEKTSTPEDSRGMYWRDGRWKLLITVTSDHLRGSGSGVPGGVIHMLGLKYNESAELPSEIGTQRVTWGPTSNTLGTIRRLLEHQGIGEGERVWLDFHEGEYFSLERARPQQGAEGLAALAEHVGEDPEGDDEALRSVISRALGLGDNGANRRILSRFRARQDGFAVQLLEDLWL